MAKFGTQSKNRLLTCDPVIQMVLNRAIVYMDFTVIFGQRSADEQFELFKKGRLLNEKGVWIIVDQAKVVTYKDGTNKLSKHNIVPLAKAVDVAPWPTLWKDMNKFHELAGVIKTVQDQLYEEGQIQEKLNWGYDLWQWDEGHWEI
jgi:hypothetical protein